MEGTSLESGDEIQDSLDDPFFVYNFFCLFSSSGEADGS